jgi:hypothetical protein
MEPGRNNNRYILYCTVTVINKSNLQYHIEGKGLHTVYTERMGCMDEILNKKWHIQEKTLEQECDYQDSSFNNLEKSRTFVYFYSKAPLCFFSIVGQCHEFCPGFFMNRFPLSP